MAATPKIERALMTS